MRVRDLRAALSDIADARPDDAPLQRAVKTLLTRTAGQEAMSIVGFLRLLKSQPSTKRVAAAAAPSAIAQELKAAFDDDVAFERVLADLKSQRSATKAVLADAFNILFERSGGVPKKATRAEILRLIADERHILVRNEKMGRMLGRRVIAAE